MTVRVARNYEPLPVTLVRGEGAHLWDDRGRRYLDFAGAYSAVSHGHSHPRLVAALAEQAGRLAITSRAFDNDRLEPFLDKLCRLSGFDKALPMNTGAEAVETAIKAARRWGYRRMHIPHDEAVILVAEGNFHGRTTTITGFSTEEEYRADFGPFAPGFRAVPYGDADAMRAAFDGKVCAILVEPIQGEAGIVVPPAGYLKDLRALCDTTGALLLLDEIQSGLGRSGRWFAFQHEDVTPDGIMVGKALGGGLLPVSAFLARADVMAMFTPGSHGSTFGGNPLAAHVALEALRVMEDEGLVERSARLGEHLLRRLHAIQSPAVKAVRGRGLWAGLELDPQEIDAEDFCRKLAQKGVLTKSAHGTTIRIAPPLVIGEDDLNKGLDIIEQALREETGQAVPSPRPVLAMCAPEHFTVSYRINPWMAPDAWEADRAALSARARDGWAALRDAYGRQGAEIHFLPPQYGLPDMVFTANAAVALDGTVLLPRFRHAERQGEERHVRAFFETLLRFGAIARLAEMPEGIFLEGAGDAVWDGAHRRFWLGYGFRSDRAAAEVLEKTFGQAVTPLELTDARYYHLDTCLAALSGGEILHYPPAFTAQGRAAIEDASPEAIAVDDADAAAFAVNCFELPGKQLFMGACSAALEARLKARGYTVHHFALEPFLLSGGSACCLTLHLGRRS